MTRCRFGRHGRRAAGLLLGAAVTTACAVTVPPRLPIEAEWTAARQRLAELRASEANGPTTALVRVSLREPRTGKTFAARGAVAVDPHRALRMILVGPGGATAIDVWATPERWRFEVPAADLLRRGARDDDPNLPIAFFRWWFLAPVEGRLLTSVAGPENAERLVLRDEGATVDLVDRPDGADRRFTASRRADGRSDSVAFEGHGLSFAPGDHATYDDLKSGVHVEVTVESLGGRPDPEAFRDPDAEPPR